MTTSSRNASSDGLFDSYFSEFTEEDFRKIDEAVAGSLNGSFPPEIDGLNFNTEDDWANLPDIEQSVISDNEGQSDSSFASEIDGLNLGTLTEEELQKLDAFISESYSLGRGGPSVPIVPEHVSAGSSTTLAERKKLKSPLRQFRRQGVFSVTDLSQPTWCEVQFDYGLRGKRSRPIESRPSTFKSASGKTISVEQNVAEMNDIRTKQGLAIHKELQIEIRANELQVNVSTKETQWALRIVNVMACLKELLHGPRNMTREMPVFGIINDEVVVGIIDEVVCEPSVESTTRKRKPSDGIDETPLKNRPSFSESPGTNLDEFNDTKINCEESKSGYQFYLRDAKTRRWPSIPDDTEALAGRLQLYLYFTLLRNLITQQLPFDFDFLWRKLDLDPDAKLPTKFLVQAQLISDNEDFALVSLNDLVKSFYKLINDHTMDVSPVLELVYYLRPSQSWKGKKVDRVKVVAVSEPIIVTEQAGPSLRRDMEELKVQADEDINSATKSRHDNVEEGGIRRFPYIGKKAFVYNKQEMDGHVSRLLEWWRGERLPEGVPIHLTNRCRTCEYADDCEWRDAKALELRNAAQLVKSPRS